MNQSKNANFDSVARFYDRLAKLVFGNTLIDAQLHFLNRIPSNGEVLILGGGSGELLEHLLRVQPNCKVCYIDASEKMITLARNRVGSHEGITFIHGTEKSTPQALQVDVVITNFYLDLFTIESLRQVIRTIKAHMKPGGIWLVTDFVKTNRVLDNALLRAMYWFFKITTRIEASDLTDWRAVLRNHFAEPESKSFRKGFVRSSLFRQHHPFT